MKEKAKNMELNIMCCLLLKPTLMEQLIIEDSEFKNYKRLWKFLKAFYNRFKNFDIELMVSVCNDKYQILEYAEMIMERQATTAHFEDYQHRLLELNRKQKYESFFSEKIYEYLFELDTEQINTEEFVKKTNELYKKIQMLPWDE